MIYTMLASVGWKVLVGAFLAILLGYLWLNGRALAAERDTAVAARDRLAASLLVMQANDRSVRALEAQTAEAAHKRKTVFDFIDNEVRHVPSKPVPSQCKPACAAYYAPIVAAVDGLRRLRRDAGSAAAADAAVR